MRRREWPALKGPRWSCVQTTPSHLRNPEWPSTLLALPESNFGVSVSAKRVAQSSAYMCRIDLCDPDHLSTWSKHPVLEVTSTFHAREELANPICGQKVKAANPARRGLYDNKFKVASQVRHIGTLGEFKLVGSQQFNLRKLGTK